MKKIAFLALLATTAFTPALAADLGRPVYKAPIAVAAPYMSWNGFYIGIQGGYAWGDTDMALAFVEPATQFGNHKTDGGLFGGTAGINWQSGAWVFGLEGDYGWAGIRGSTSCVGDTLTCSSRINSFGTGRGRIGYSFGNAMIYGTGGAAFGNLRVRVSDGVNSASAEEFRVGWTAGGGVEWMFGGNWSAKLEGLYYDLGRETYTLDGFVPVATRHNGVLVRAGINYRFNWGGPVVASY